MNTEKTTEMESLVENFKTEYVKFSENESKNRSGTGCFIYLVTSPSPRQAAAGRRSPHSNSGERRS